MDRRNLFAGIAGLVLGGALILGCEQKPSATPAPSGQQPRGTPSTPQGGAPSTPQGGGAASGQQARAQSLIDEVNSDIQNHDFTAADKKLSELESMKSNLPPAMQKQVDTLRSTLNRAKGGGNGGGTSPSGGAPSGGTPSTPPSNPNNPPSGGTPHEPG